MALVFYLENSPVNHIQKHALLYSRNTRYNSEQSTQATRLYHEIAIKNGLTLTELSLAFIEQQPFVTSTIIGTTVEQLKENIDTIQVTLSEEV
jgi:aryl-alcohol dehydrogenase-like predicted oxidoreductase